MRIHDISQLLPNQMSCTMKYKLILQIRYCWSTTLTLLSFWASMIIFTYYPEVIRIDWPFSLIYNIWFEFQWHNLALYHIINHQVSHWHISMTLSSIFHDIDFPDIEWNFAKCSRRISICNLEVAQCH
jgi:hypothetical protein